MTAPRSTLPLFQWMEVTGCSGVLEDLRTILGRCLILEAFAAEIAGSAQASLLPEQQ